jgi:5-methyltetrahydropteroyltriglutamate--homocysteine methyltransferase
MVLMVFPYRADHVGSLLRPAELLEARTDPAVTPEQRREIEDRHILRVLARQRDIGLEIFTDGEFRRAGFMSDFHDSVEGLDTAAAVSRTWRSSPASSGSLASLPGIVTRKLRQKKRWVAEQADFLKRHSPGDIKITLPTANQFPAIAYKKGISEQAYATRSEFLWDIVPMLRAEIQALLAEGVNYIQIDAPRYSYYIDPKWRQYVRDEMDMDPAEALEEAIRADNACLEGARSRGAVIAMHLCRGNNRSQWYAEGGYDPIAEKLFTSLNVDAFLLEYESERAGTFEPLRFVPADKFVVLGLVSSKTPELESKDRLLKRIDEASRWVPLERLALSPQCGFASVAEGNLLTEDDQWRKLELVVATAEKMWS